MWAAHCITYLFVVVAVLFVKFDLSERPNALVGLALASDVVFSPFLPVNYPAQVGLLTTVVNVAVAFVLLRLCIPLIQHTSGESSQRWRRASLNSNHERSR